MPGYHTFTDTLPAGHHTGSTTLTGTRTLLTPTFPADYVGTLTLMVYTTADFTFASADSAGAEVPGLKDTWFEIPVINADLATWFKQSGGSGATLYYWFLIKTTLGNV